jgi:hypothetical protein
MSTFMLRLLAILGGLSFFDVVLAIWRSPHGSGWEHFESLIFAAVWIVCSWGICLRQQRSIGKLRGQVEGKVLDQLTLAPQIVTLGLYIMMMDRVLPAFRH